jgi:hypothetical protein
VCRDARKEMKPEPREIKRNANGLYDFNAADLDRARTVSKRFLTEFAGANNIPPKKWNVACAKLSYEFRDEGWGWNVIGALLNRVIRHQNTRFVGEDV